VGAGVVAVIWKSRRFAEHSQSVHLLVSISAAFGGHRDDVVAAEMPRDCDTHNRLYSITSSALERFTN